ncbi:MAG: hypothetical protein K2M53_05650 [Muribaculaceae bacterium]|nr:hypothetical protein [Muribaculaceae bacterium]
MKKLIYLFGVVVLALVGTGCNNSSNQKNGLGENTGDTGSYMEEVVVEAEEVEEQTPSYTSASNNETQISDENSLVTTYEFSDCLNQTWVVEINDDKTATMYLKGAEMKFYGSWDNWGPKKKFRFSNKHPAVEFPGGEDRIFYPVISDGYFYKDTQSSEAKDPEFRLPIKKI